MFIWFKKYFYQKSFKEIVTDLWKNKFFKVIFFTFLLFFILNLLFPLKINPKYSTIITAKDGSILHAFLSDDDKWRMFVELNEITPTLKKAIIEKEDKYFYWHLGVNPVAIGRAAFNNIIQQKRTSGASTITMQVIRLLYPNQRTYWHKITEILRAIQLEIFYSKEEILQLYLNLVPYGSNIEGIKSASMLYFQKSPDRLSLAEVTTLAIIPNRPTSLKLGSKNPLIIQERNRWLEYFRKGKVFENQQINDAIREPLNVSRHEAPKNAPHLAFRLKNEFPTEPIIHSTLNRSIQAKTEQIVANYVNRIRAKNIQNAAVLVINNKTMQIEAYIGSADFDNKADGGQVDGIRAIRSPGSALKPILYATAFDKGIITPKNIINDVPTNFSGFEPENFDKRFNGAVTVEFSLANSLNIPAVKVLRDLGKKELIEVLKKADFQTVRKQEKDLGLSIVLGGCGVTLEEMTKLYTIFANEGVFFDLEYRMMNDEWGKEQTGNKSKFRTQKPARSTQHSELLTPNSTYLITQILSQIKRPDLPNNFDYTYHLPKIAWKTGTSFGKRDAWSIGYNKNYTIGVWVGNFSGLGVPELSGAEIATPLLFQIFNTIDYNSVNSIFKQPKEVVSRQVCAETGDLPTEYCTNKILDFHIKGVSHTRKCEHRKRFFVSYSESTSYCVSCLPPNGNYKEKIYPNLAPELIAYYESKKIFYEKIPPHNPNCSRIFRAKNNAPLITSLNEGSEYLIDKADPQKIQLACQAANDSKEVFWYQNDKLIQKTASNLPIFFLPESGKIKISCVDDKGRSSNVWIKVKVE